MEAYDEHVVLDSRPAGGIRAFDFDRDARLAEPPQTIGGWVTLVLIGASLIAGGVMVALTACG